MDRNSKLRGLYIFFLATTIFLNSCLPEKEPAPYPYAIELNPLRKNVGLRAIDSTFYRGAYGYKSVSTFNKVNNIYYNSYMKPKERSKKPKTQPLYWEKYIKLNRKTGKPEFEQDIYRSGFYKYGYMEETDIFETLKYRYIFEDYSVFDIKSTDSIHIKKGWQYIYEYPIEKKGVTSNKPKSKYWERKSKKITQKQADSILKSWKIHKEN